MAEADLILHGGSVVTLDRASTIAEAVAVRDGRILAVGPKAALRQHAGPATRQIDLRGRTVVPGLFDAHPHVDREGLKTRGGIPIEGLRSVEAIVEVVREAARAAKPGEWIVLMPMGSPPHEYVSHPEELEEGRFPTRHDLDAVGPDNPVYIRAVWGWWSHRPFPSVANSQALARAGITRDTVAPHNVEIVRDAHGEPTGVFLERNYVPVLEYTLFKMLPRFTQEDRVEGVRRGVRTFTAAGTTAVFEGHALTPAVIRAYRAVQARGGFQDITWRSMAPTRDDFRRSWSPIARGSLLGAVLGALPGTGATMSAFLSYALEKRLARDPSRFRKGAIEGVAAADAANSAAAQAAFIPTMTLGIPSNSVTALMIGALMIHGIVPGPTVVSERPDLSGASS